MMWWWRWWGRAIFFFFFSFFFIAQMRSIIWEYCIITSLYHGYAKDRQDSPERFSCSTTLTWCIRSSCQRCANQGCAKHPSFHLPQGRSSHTGVVNSYHMAHAARIELARGYWQRNSTQLRSGQFFFSFSFFFC